nr:hypothetical protein [Angustibacter aerolatus]
MLPAVVLLGLTLGSVPDLGAAGRAARVAVVAPGVLALAVVSTAFTGQAIQTGFDRRYGVLRLLGTTPLGRGGLLAGKAVGLLAVEPRAGRRAVGDRRRPGLAPRGVRPAAGVARAAARQRHLRLPGPAAGRHPPVGGRAGPGEPDLAGAGRRRCARRPGVVDARGPVARRVGAALGRPRRGGPGGLRRRPPRPRAGARAARLGRRRRARRRPLVPLGLNAHTAPVAVRCCPHGRPRAPARTRLGGPGGRRGHALAGRSRRVVPADRADGLGPRRGAGTVRRRRQPHRARAGPAARARDGALGRRGHRLDGLLHLDGGKVDAIMVEVSDDGGGPGVLVARCYRPAGRLRGLRLDDDAAVLEDDRPPMF